MSMMKILSEALGATGSSLKSLVKMALQSRRATVMALKDLPAGPIIVMGNGPSLSQTIARDMPVLKSHPSLAVNFAALAPEFAEIKPRFYVLADPHFVSDSDNPNLVRLWDNLRCVTWQMTLLVPVPFRDRIIGRIGSNSHIDVATFNAVGVEGWQWLCRLAYSKGWGMPRPRNVLIPSVMLAMWLGYRDIYIVGADHSWMKTISVNDRNEVVSIQPHFYKDDDKEIERVTTEYLKYPLHQIVHSFYVAFKAYHEIYSYARHHGVEIFNATSESFIDAFPRRGLPE